MSLEKKVSLLGYFKTFKVKSLRKLKKLSWKQEIERAQPQAPTSRNCACSCKQILCSHFFEVFVNCKSAKLYSLTWNNILVIRCFHMVLLQNFIGKNVWNRYLRGKRRRQCKESSKIFFVLSLPLHIRKKNTVVPEMQVKRKIFTRAAPSLFF